MGRWFLCPLQAKSFVRSKLHVGAFDCLQCQKGGRKELKSMSQVNSQVFTGCYTKQIYMVVWKPNVPFNCSEVIYSQEENLDNFSAVKGIKDFFGISHLKFLHFLISLITYLLIGCVAQGSFEWWDKEEKSFCSSWSHWRSTDRILFGCGRKSWRRSTEEIKNGN